jgi:hypothetical protein
MAFQIEGQATVPNGTYQTLSTTATPRQCFIQARSNTFVRRVGSADVMIVLGETTGSAVDLGVQAPNSLEFAGVSSTSIVSMWSLDIGERR